MDINNYNEMMPKIAGMKYIMQIHSMRGISEPEDADTDNRVFYRIETVDDKGETTGGCVSFAYSLLALILGIHPAELTPEILAEKQRSSQAYDYAFAVYGAIASIPKPDVYINDKDNNYCFYSNETFQYLLKADVFTLLDIMGENITMGTYRIVYKKFKIKNEDIVYEDRYQCVISKETYEKLNKSGKYEYIKDKKYRSYKPCEVFDEVF